MPPLLSMPAGPSARHGAPVVGSGATSSVILNSATIIPPSVLQMANGSSSTSANNLSTRLAFPNRSGAAQGPLDSSQGSLHPHTLMSDRKIPDLNSDYQGRYAGSVSRLSIQKQIPLTQPRHTVSPPPLSTVGMDGQTVGAAAASSSVRVPFSDSSKMTRPSMMTTTTTTSVPSPSANAFNPAAHRLSLATTSSRGTAAKSRQAPPIGSSTSNSATLPITNGHLTLPPNSSEMLAASFRCGSSNIVPTSTSQSQYQRQNAGNAPPPPLMDSIVQNTNPLTIPHRSTYNANASQQHHPHHSSQSVIPGFTRLPVAASSASNAAISVYPNGAVLQSPSLSKSGGSTTAPGGSTSKTIGGATTSRSSGGASSFANTSAASALVKGRKFNPLKTQRDPQSAISSVLQSSRNLYRIEKLLQTAIYGAVFLATEVNSQSQRRPVAMKIMFRELERRHRGTLQEDMLAELKFFKEMKGHPNLLVYDDCWEDRDCVYLVMPFAAYEDLFEVLKKRRIPLAEREARWLFMQIIDGTAHLNSKGVAFRDHSLENVLMFYNSDDGTVYPRITDPGQAVHFQFDEQHRPKQLIADKLFGKSFRPPEVYSKRPYSPVKVDTFCLGWMLFFAVTKHQAFDRAVDTDPHWSLIKRGRFAELLKVRGGSYLSSALTDLLLKMLSPDQSLRPSPKQSLEHKWFKNGHKSPLDDRTIYGLAGHTADRLPPHPAVVKRQEARARKLHAQQQQIKLQALKVDQQEVQHHQVSCPPSTTANTSTHFSSTAARQETNKAVIASMQAHVDSLRPPQPQNSSRAGSGSFQVTAGGVIFDACNSAVSSPAPLSDSDPSRVVYGSSTPAAHITTTTQLQPPPTTLILGSSMQRSTNPQQQQPTVLAPSSISQPTQHTAVMKSHLVPAPQQQQPQQPQRTNRALNGVQDSNRALNALPPSSIRSEQPNLLQHTNSNSLSTSMSVSTSRVASPLVGNSPVAAFAPQSLHGLASGRGVNRLPPLATPYSSSSIPSTAASTALPISTSTELPESSRQLPVAPLPSPQERLRKPIVTSTSLPLAECLPSVGAVLVPAASQITHPHHSPLQQPLSRLASPLSSPPPHAVPAVASASPFGVLAMTATTTSPLSAEDSRIRNSYPKTVANSIATPRDAVRPAASVPYTQQEASALPPAAPFDFQSRKSTFMSRASAPSMSLPVSPPARSEIPQPTSVVVVRSDDRRSPQVPTPTATPSVAPNRPVVTVATAGESVVGASILSPKVAESVFSRSSPQAPTSVVSTPPDVQFQDGCSTSLVSRDYTSSASASAASVQSGAATTTLWPYRETLQGNSMAEAEDVNNSGDDDDENDDDALSSSYGDDDAAGDPRDEESDTDSDDRRESKMSQRMSQVSGSWSTGSSSTTTLRGEAARAPSYCSSSSSTSSAHTHAAGFTSPDGVTRLAPEVPSPSHVRKIAAPSEFRASIAAASRVSRTVTDNPRTSAVSERTIRGCAFRNEVLLRRRSEDDWMTREGSVDGYSSRMRLESDSEGSTTRPDVDGSFCASDQLQRRDSVPFSTSSRSSAPSDLSVCVGCPSPEADRSQAPLGLEAKAAPLLPQGSLLQDTSPASHGLQDNTAPHLAIAPHSRLDPPAQDASTGVVVNTNTTNHGGTVDRRMEYEASSETQPQKACENASNGCEVRDAVVMQKRSTETNSIALPEQAMHVGHTKRIEAPPPSQEEEPKNRRTANKPKSNSGHGKKKGDRVKMASRGSREASAKNHGDGKRRVKRKSKKQFLDSATNGSEGVSDRTNNSVDPIPTTAIPTATKSSSASTVVSKKKQQGVSNHNETLTESNSPIVIAKCREEALSASPRALKLLNAGAEDFQTCGEQRNVGVLPNGTMRVGKTSTSVQVAVSPFATGNAASNMIQQQGNPYYILQPAAAGSSSSSPRSQQPPQSLQGISTESRSKIGHLDVATGRLDRSSKQSQRHPQPIESSTTASVRLAPIAEQQPSSVLRWHSNAPTVATAFEIVKVPNPTGFDTTISRSSKLPGSPESSRSSDGSLSGSRVGKPLFMSNEATNPSSPFVTPAALPPVNTRPEVLHPIGISVATVPMLGVLNNSGMANPAAAQLYPTTIGQIGSANFLARPQPARGAPHFSSTGTAVRRSQTASHPIGIPTASTTLGFPYNKLLQQPPSRTTTSGSISATAAPFFVNPVPSHSHSPSANLVGSVSRAVTSSTTFFPSLPSHHHHNQHHHQQATTSTPPIPVTSSASPFVVVHNPTVAPLAAGHLVRRSQTSAPLFPQSAAPKSFIHYLPTPLASPMSDAASPVVSPCTPPIPQLLSPAPSAVRHSSLTRLQRSPSAASSISASTFGSESVFSVSPKAMQVTCSSPYPTQPSWAPIGVGAAQTTPGRMADAPLIPISVQTPQIGVEGRSAPSFIVSTHNPSNFPTSFGQHPGLRSTGGKSFLLPSNRLNSLVPSTPLQHATNSS